MHVIHNCYEHESISIIKGYYGEVIYIGAKVAECSYLTMISSCILWRILSLYTSSNSKLIIFLMMCGLLADEEIRSQ